jgi:hypothetical protein
MTQEAKVVRSRNEGVMASQTVTGCGSVLPFVGMALLALAKLRGMW